MIDSVIFDMDGLMFDTERVWATLWEPALATLGLSYKEGLDDAAGGGEQGGVGDAEEQVAGGLVRAVETDELHTVLPHIAAGDGGADGQRQRHRYTERGPAAYF